MDLRDIRYFIAVVENGSMTEAARSIFVSQPTISLSIKKLEEELNVALFFRKGNALHLTAAGSLLFEQGKLLLQESKEIVKKLTEFSADSQERIRFGISPFYSKYYIPPLYQHYKRNYPNITLEIEEKISVELEEEVINGQLPFAFLPGYPQRAELSYRSVGVEQIYLALPPGHPMGANAVAAYDGVPYLDVSTLINVPFILQSQHQKIAHMQSAIFRHFNFYPDIVYETNNWDTIYTFISVGIGAGFLPEILRLMPMRFRSPKFYRIAGIDTTRIYAVAYLPQKKLSLSEERLISAFSDIVMHPNTGDAG